jgi:hypothetical protein
MSDTFFKVFKHTSDHNKWDKQIEYMNINEDISDDIRHEIVESYQFLRGVN